MVKKDYTPLEKLTSELNDKIKQLKSGNLTVSEVGALVKSSQEVYNRLIILEFQMHENSGAINVQSDSLNDKKAIQSGVIEEKEASEMPEFNFNLSEEEKSEVPLVEPEELVMEEPEVKEGTKPVETPVLEKVSEALEATSPEDLQGGSLAEKFENAPISDISKAFSLNEKFQFMRVLSGNDSENFKVLVEKLNGSSNESEAMSYFNQVVSEPTSEDDKEIYDSFKELISRRFS